MIADAATVGELAGSPDVRSVRTIVPKTAMNSNAVALTRTLRAWQQAGWLGDGVRIGIIDDGIDYTHAGFGGPGTRAAYTAIDRTMVKPSYFPTSKVVGGYDFAGDDYDGGVTASSLGIIPRPDPTRCPAASTVIMSPPPRPDSVSTVTAAPFVATTRTWTRRR